MQLKTKANLSRSERQRQEAEAFIPFFRNTYT